MWLTQSRPRPSAAHRPRDDVPSKRPSACSGSPIGLAETLREAEQRVAASPPWKSPPACAAAIEMVTRYEPEGLGAYHDLMDLMRQRHAETIFRRRFEHR